MAPENKPVSSLTWVIISAAGFVVFIGVAAFFIFFNDKLSNISLPLYFFLLVVAGLIAAAFLSGAMKSQAKYSGKIAGGTLDLAGPVVVFALIVYMGYRFRPVAGFTGLKVTVFGDSTQNILVNAGMVKILLNKPDSANIRNGLAEFTDIPSEFSGKEVTVIPIADGYYSTSAQVKISNDGLPAEIHLIKKPDSVTVSGIVTDTKGNTISHAVILFEDGIAKDTSDNYGNFRITLPFKEGHESKVRVYVKNVLVYNNDQVLSAATSMTLQIHK